MITIDYLLVAERWERREKKRKRVVVFLCFVAHQKVFLLWLWFSVSFELCIRIHGITWERKNKLVSVNENKVNFQK